MHPNMHRNVNKHSTVTVGPHKNQTIGQWRLVRHRYTSSNSAPRIGLPEISETRRKTRRQQDSHYFHSHLQLCPHCLQELCAHCLQELFHIVFNNFVHIVIDNLARIVIYNLVRILIYNLSLKKLQDELRFEMYQLLL